MDRVVNHEIVNEYRSYRQIAEARRSKKRKELLQKVALAVLGVAVIVLAVLLFAPSVQAEAENNTDLAFRQVDNNKVTVNNMNVFPVPDGDTGINMTLTMASVRGLGNFDGTVSDCADKIANMVLRSARGNSGAILSLFFRGIAKSLKGLDEATSALDSETEKKLLDFSVTDEELSELKTKCKWEWTVINGVNGYKVIGKNGNYIFLPASGIRKGNTIIDRGENIYYWSGTGPSHKDFQYGALCMYIRDGSKVWDWYRRSHGLSIRPVKNY